MKASAPTIPVWFTSDLRWITASRAARSLSQGYLIVVLPLYLLQIGFNGVSLGELFTIGAFISALLTVSVSLAADQIGRKPFLIIFPVFTALGAIALIFSTNFWIIVAACALGTLGRGGGAGGAGSGGPFYPAQQALIADHSSAGDRNAVFAAFSFTDSIASTTGALLAGIPDLLTTRLAFAPADSYRPLFALTSVLAAVMLVSILPVRETVKRRSKSEPRRAYLPTKSRNVIGRLAFTNLVNGVGVGFFGPFVSYWFYRRFGASPGTIGLLFAAVNLGAAIPYLLAPGLARKLGVVKAVVGVRLVGVALLALLPLMPSFLLAATVYFLRMAFQRASIPLRQSYSMGVVSKEERSAAAGLSNLPSQVSASISPLPAGYIFQNISLELPFEIGAAFQLLNALLFFSLFRQIRPPEESRTTERTAAAH